VNLSVQTRELSYSILTILLLTLLAAGAIILASSIVSTRLAAVLIGGLACWVGARFSRNPRLFCLWCLGFSIPFLFAKTIGPVINKGGGEVAFNIDVTDIFLVVFCAYLARDLRNGRTAIRVPKSAYFWIAIMLWGFYAIIAGPYRTTAAHEVVRMVKMLVLFIVLCNELETPRRILHWCAALSTGLLVNAITGLAQFHYHRTFGLADLGEPSADVTETLAAVSLNGVSVWRVGAFLLHPNIFGAFLAALLPLMIACFLIRGKRMQKLYFLAVFVLGVGALLATDSRSGWISFSVAFCCFMMASFAHGRLRQRSALAGIAIFILILGILWVGREQIATRIFDSKAEALSFREMFKGDARRMIADRPLWGSGLNAYVLQLPAYAEYRYGSWPPPVHQIYYLWWAETGLVGLCFHLALWAGIVWIGLRNFRVRDERMFAVNAACVVGMLALALDGFVSFSLRLTPILKIFWSLAAMMMSIRYWRLRAEMPVRRFRRIPAADLPDLAPAGPPNR
jgi:O-antigen ligase